MHDDLAEPRDDGVREIARALRRAAGEHDHVAALQRLAHGGFERRLIIGERAVRDRLAAGFGYGCRKDRAVAVVDTRRP